MKSLQYYSIVIGNLLRGATDTPRQRLRHGALASAPVTIKQPPKYDLSHWGKVLTWTGMNPRPVDVYTKATEGTWYKDPTMPEYMAGMLSIGAKRGVYHFNRKTYDPITQAKWFLAYVKPYIDVNTRLILDVEENDTPADAMVKWFEYVISQRPNNPVALYGRAEQLNRITMNASQRAFMKTIPVIVAGYPTYPNNFDTIPSAYIPDQTKYGKVTDWQYSDVGVVEGIDGDVDLNMIIDGGTVEIPPPTGDKMKYDATAIDNSTKTRPNHNTVTDFTPSRYHNAGTVFSGDELWVADNVNKDASQFVGDKWLRVKEINGLAVSDCWVAVVHKGTAICTLVENVVTPPPAESVDVAITVKGAPVGKVTVNGQEWKKV